ncbi:hypothetical protein AZI98_03865 [Aeribacillus pallidus]|uniref:Uncharacterized protein n=1 Tax=Aeribacillus pallidus TaxID=33936 RepID=A0A165YSG9_9BACI|nr:hypothetical protein AZI98_03865 [Aeribacillus pallidus]
MQSQFIKDLITLPDFLIQGGRKEGEHWIFELSPLLIVRSAQLASVRQPKCHRNENNGFTAIRITSAYFGLSFP